MGGAEVTVETVCHVVRVQELESAVVRENDTKVSKMDQKNRKLRTRGRGDAEETIATACRVLRAQELKLLRRWGFGNDATISHMNNRNMEITYEGREEGCGGDDREGVPRAPSAGA